MDGALARYFGPIFASIHLLGKLYQTASWCRCLWVSRQLLRHFAQTLDYLRERLHLPKTPGSREPNIEPLLTREILHVRAVVTSYMLSLVITRKGSVSSNPAGHLLDVMPLFHISERKLGCTMLFHLFRIVFYSFQKISFKTSFHSLSVWMRFYHVYMCGACR